MALEEQIVEWGASREPWQRDVLRRVATGQPLTEKEYDTLLEDLIAIRPPADDAFRLEHLPQSSPNDPPVTLAAIADLSHVNALESDAPLTCDPVGFTIIYGDNGSGKSGYARLLKRIARARHQEDVLSDVFRDTSVVKPTAAIAVRIDGQEQKLAWPEGAIPALQRMLFFDEACGDSYSSAESNYPYRPTALFVMDGLIEACLAVRARVDARLEANTTSAKTLPTVDEALKQTGIGKYLAALSGTSSIADCDQLLAAAGPGVIAELKTKEASLTSADPTAERQRLSREATKLDSVQHHLEALKAALAKSAISGIDDQRDRVQALEDAAKALTGSLSAEPLPSTGSSPWRELWESARRFSEAGAYSATRFPAVADDSRCVLCQQELSADARERLARLERFVQDDTQVQLRQAREARDHAVKTLRELAITSETIEAHLKDLEVGHANLIQTTGDVLAEIQAAHETVVNAVDAGEPLPEVSVSWDVSTQLKEAASSARRAVDALASAETIQRELATVSATRKELELCEQLKARRSDIVATIARLKEREALERVKAAAATGPVTVKVLQLSEDHITDVIRDAFTRETDRLFLERVSITKTRADRGAVLHQPKLVGAHQNVTLPRVFSEGERTALGLSAFFTEALLEPSKSAMILDDPVSSLDHVRRERVAARLATFAQTRQVIVFTHDVGFVADLKREAKGLKVPIAERSVMRGRGGDRKPGACIPQHPWKAKDVPERLGELRVRLARIEKESASWDQDTYEEKVASWAGGLSETWERIMSQEIAGAIVAEGGTEVRPNMVKVLTRFSETDESEFQASYSRVSRWAKRHDKSTHVNYVPPEQRMLKEELDLVDQWFKRVKAYKN